MLSPAVNRFARAMAGALCAGWFVAVLLQTAESVVLTPDSAHYAAVARNLVRGAGYTIDVVPYHVDASSEIRRVPEMHGLLRPVALAGLFAAFGIESPLVRVPGLAFVAGTALLAFALGRRLFGPVAGLLACGLTLANPLLLWLGWTGLDDAGFACLFLASLTLLERALAERRTALFAAAGAVAGTALLEKLMGIFAPALCLALPLCARGVPRARWLRWAAAYLAPFAAAVALYLLRNVAVAGSPMFRFSAIEWIWKAEGYYGAFALFERAPSLPATLASLGFGRVAALVAEQFARLPRAALEISTPAWLVPLGMASLVLHWRRRREFAVLGLLTLAASTAFVCVFYHVEHRYFAFWYPLLAVSLAGALAEAAGPRGGRGARRALAVAAGVALAAGTGLVAGRELRAELRRYGTHREGGLCFDAVAFGRERIARDEPVLAVEPWRLNWDLDRPTVLAPSGGARALTRVARRYGTRWLVLQASPGRGQGRLLAELHRFVSRPPRGWRVELAFDGRSCDLYRLRWEGSSAS
jgi:hypothetical protein